MKQSAIRWWMLGLLALALVSSPVAAETAKAKDSAQASESGEETGAKLSPFVLATGGRGSGSTGKVYGNDDLAKMYGGETEPAPDASDEDAKVAKGPEPEPGVAPADALEQLFANENAKVEHAATIAAAEQEVASAKKQVADLDKRMLAVKNPFLARPDAPKEGAEEWQEADSEQRVRKTEDEMLAAREALAKAERELAALRNERP